jgi:hypothetical protein
VEVISADIVGGRIRDGIHFVLPVNMELRRSPFRVYGSIGYFTRGSAFSGGAIEWRTPARMLLVGAITQSYSVKKAPVLDELSIGRQRVDVMATAALHLVKRSAVYVSVARSLSSFDDGGTKLARIAGLAVGF